jgi:FRG domain
MTVEIIRTSTPSRFFGALNKLWSSNRNIVFRGHRYSKWRLASTLARHRPTASYSPVIGQEVEEMLRHFLINLKTTGRDPPYNRDGRRARLEFGRHYGVPSPLIDFSRSPYVAAFFAFAGVRPHEAKRGDQCTVYCLNMFELAGIWARLKTTMPKFENADD